MTSSQIAIDLDSRDPEIIRLERHSYVNLINVVHAELQLIERMIDRPGSLRSAIHLAEAASRAFKEARVARRHLGELVRFGTLVESDLEEALQEAGDLAGESDVQEACAILRDVLPDAHLRVQEVVARHEIARPVEHWGPVELTERLSEFGADVMIEEERDSIELPRGLEDTLVTIAQQSSELDRIELHVGDPVEVVLELVAPSGYLDPLTRRLRPSELHSILEEAGQPLRGIIQLTYLTIPTGSATITTVEGGRAGDPAPAAASPSPSARFVVRAEIAEPDPLAESD